MSKKEINDYRTEVVEKLANGEDVVYLGHHITWVPIPEDCTEPTCLVCDFCAYCPASLNLLCVAVDAKAKTVGCFLFFEDK